MDSHHCWLWKPEWLQHHDPPCWRDLNGLLYLPSNDLVQILPLHGPKRDQMDSLQISLLTLSEFKWITSLTYSEPRYTPKIGFVAKIIKHFQPKAVIFIESSILDVADGSECVSQFCGYVKKLFEICEELLIYPAQKNKENYGFYSFCYRNP